MSGERLTGRRRYRVESCLFGPSLIVVQVEIEYEVSRPYGGHIDTSTYRSWRDARVEDLTVFEGAQL